MTDSAGHAYYRKRLTGGDSKTEALRCLKRQLSRTVYHRLRTDDTHRHHDQPAAA